LLTWVWFLGYVLSAPKATGRLTDTDVGVSLDAGTGQTAVRGVVRKGSDDHTAGMTGSCRIVCVRVHSYAYALRKGIAHDLPREKACLYVPVFLIGKERKKRGERREDEKTEKGRRSTEYILYRLLSYPLEPFVFVAVAHARCLVSIFTSVRAKVAFLWFRLFSDGAQLQTK
jgi:hypothetical protein